LKIPKTASNPILKSKGFSLHWREPDGRHQPSIRCPTLSQLQEDRHFADYNLTKDLDLVEALTQVKSAEKIFNTWPAIRGEQISQAYLVSLLVKRV
jgi:hypothetical protein